MPVHKIVDEMPYDEFLGWVSYFQLRPPGWQEDSRFMKILQAIGIKAKPEEVFNSLKQMRESNRATETGVPAIKQSYLFQLMLGSSGDKPDFLKELS